MEKVIFPKEQKTYTAAQVEAAQCAWEFLLDKQQLSGHDWEGGACMARDDCRLIAPLIVAIYDAAEKLKPDFSDGRAFDWEVVPDIVSMFKPAYCPMRRGTIPALPMTVKAAAAELVAAYCQ